MTQICMCVCECVCVIACVSDVCVRETLYHSILFSVSWWTEQHLTQNLQSHNLLLTQHKLKEEQLKIVNEQQQ